MNEEWGLGMKGKMSREEQGLTQGHTMVKLGQSHGVQTPIWAIFFSTKSTVRHCGGTRDTALPSRCSTYRRERESNSPGGVW